jgi:uncharacterized repeat protein (TIGR03803 family)
MTKKRNGCAGLLGLACVLALASVPTAQAQAPTDTVLYSFAGPAQGATPRAGLIRDSVGNLYGTTVLGGTANLGTVFRLNPAGQLTVLHTFTGVADGAYPYAGVTLDSAGNLYGAASAGAAKSPNCKHFGPGRFRGCGTVFKLDGAGNFAVLHSFTGGADGGQPLAAVTRDSAGNLYGTTYGGGSAGLGVVYKIDTSGNATVLYSFGSGQPSGGQPSAGVIFDLAGNLYGKNDSCVFKLDAADNYTAMYCFGGEIGAPLGGLTLDSAGNLYGTVNTGSAPNDFGTVFELSPAGQVTVLHTFSGGADGTFPDAGVTLDSAGNLYGTTRAGGPGDGGVVYKLSPAGQETVLYAFNQSMSQPCGAAGCDLASGVILDPDGNLYGTASVSGSPFGGSVYKIDPAGNETTLYRFPPGPDGEQPQSGVTLDSAGNLYGTTPIGGSMGAGTVYKVDPAGNETVLYNFTGGADGGGPSGGLIFDSAGKLYGDTYAGGTANAGVIFKMDTAGNETVLYSLNGTSDGSGPSGNLIFDASGNLYGTATNGGKNSGTVFKLSAGGQYSVLYTFKGRDDAHPLSGVILDAAGNLYGTASGDNAYTTPGLVFKLDPAGNETVLYRFPPHTPLGKEALRPVGGLVFDSAGNLYGTTSGGGTGTGVLFKVNAAGHYSVLHNFKKAAGTGPEATLMIDPTGNLYGTTHLGGARKKGVVFEISPTGRETVLHAFTGGADGGTPFGSVVFDSAGNLYGTTSAGGVNLGGVVFKLNNVQH